MASRWVHARGTTLTSAYPPPPRASQRPLGGGLGQVAERHVGRPVTVDGQVQVGQRILRVRVGAVLGDQHLRAEGPNQPGTTAWKARSQRGVSGAGRHGMFTAVPAAAPCPISSGQPVPGHSVNGDSWIEMVSTRGSS